MTQTAPPTFFAAVLLLQMTTISTPPAVQAVTLLLPVRALPSLFLRPFLSGFRRACLAASPHYRVLAKAVTAPLSILSVTTHAAAAALCTQRPPPAMMTHFRAAAFDASAFFLPVLAETAASALFATAFHTSV